MLSLLSFQITSTLNHQIPPPMGGYINFCPHAPPRPTMDCRGQAFRIIDTVCHIEIGIVVEIASKNKASIPLALVFGRTITVFVELLAGFVKIVNDTLSLYVYRMPAMTVALFGLFLAVTLIVLYGLLRQEVGLIHILIQKVLQNILQRSGFRENELA